MRGGDWLSCRCVGFQALPPLPTDTILEKKGKRLHLQLLPQDFPLWPRCVKIKLLGWASTRSHNNFRGHW